MLHTGPAQPPRHSLAAVHGYRLPGSGDSGGGQNGAGGRTGDVQGGAAVATPALWLLAAGMVSSTMAQLISFPLGLVCTRLKVTTWLNMAPSSSEILFGCPRCLWNYM